MQPERDATSAKSASSSLLSPPSSSTTFTSSWLPTDASSLAPANLPVAKAPRAWDRKPQSPFSRARVRFGKVWKRSLNPSIATLQHPTGLFNDAYALEASESGKSPMKAVKKMRVAEGAVVRDWDARGSPNAGNRRIVTRSHTAVEELVELPEEEGGIEELREQGGEHEYNDETQEEQVLQVEVVHEDGSTEELGVGQELAQDDWEDESMTEEDADEWDAALMHLADSGQKEESDMDDQTSPETVLVQDSVDEPIANTSTVLLETPELEVEPSAPSEVIATPEGQNAGGQPWAETQSEAHVRQDSTPQNDVTEASLQSVKMTPHSAIPDGFVSPAKERRSHPVRQVKKANPKRRRTLPINFQTQESILAVTNPNFVDTPARPVSPGHAPAEEESLVIMRDSTSPDEGVAIATCLDTANEDEADNLDENMGDDDQWEDVEDEQAISNSIHTRDVTPEPLPASEWIPTVENTPTSPSPVKIEINQTVAFLAQEEEEQAGFPPSPSKFPSSPASNVIGQYPGLLRRSPRRQSSSPMKRRAMLCSTEKPHLVAFTPVKRPRFFDQQAETTSLSLPKSPLVPSDQNLNETTLPHCVRSSSAPPEEPQMSPRRPPQPRISDDTAILQAFLNRAAESKNGRRLSATAKRESLENRRESDTVRQALASPQPMTVPSDVLADLDPNSPSPRKQSAVVELPTIEKNQEQSQHEEEAAASSPTGRSSRRSGRVKRKAQILPSTSYSGSTKISVRSSADPVVLKKSEAQELAQLTKNNTRKNKGGSVLPPLRLNRMTKEESSGVDSAQDIDIGMERLVKIKWAETLASFYIGDNEPEISMAMNDELSVPDHEIEASEAKTDEGTTKMQNVPPPAETSSKSKLRRLKPARTAAAAAAAAAETAPHQVSASVESDSVRGISADPKPRPSKRQSRIATPAKPRGGEIAAVLSEDVVQSEEPEHRPTGTKRRAISKLPAPMSSASTADPVSAKDNSLIASPPKKRTRSLGLPTPSGVPPAKGLGPRLHLSKPDMPSISSLAKKNFKAPLFGEASESSSSAGRQELPPSLGSPAKKRARRAVD